MAERIARLVRIDGKVQGVGYRAWTRAAAEGRGLDGWVENRPDGTVEALFAGPPAAVEAMIDACRAGPPAARVDRVAVSDPAGLSVPQGFRIGR